MSNRSVHDITITGWSHGHTNALTLVTLSIYSMKCSFVYMLAQLINYRIVCKLCPTCTADINCQFSQGIYIPIVYNNYYIGIENISNQSQAIVS